MKTKSLLTITVVCLTIASCGPIHPIHTNNQQPTKKRVVKIDRSAPIMFVRGQQYPVAQRKLDTTQNPIKNIYISPYAPYNEIEAKGFKSGQLAGDPSTCQVDSKTGKPITSTAKCFVIP